VPSVHFATERIEVVLQILSLYAAVYAPQCPFCIADGDMHPLPGCAGGRSVRLCSDVCLNVPGDAHMAGALA